MILPSPAPCWLLPPIIRICRVGFAPLTTRIDGGRGRTNSAGEPLSDDRLCGAVFAAA